MKKTSTLSEKTITQKEKLIAKLHQLDKKIKAWDNKRIMQVGQLAKRYNLVNLSNSILNKEFHTLQEKYALKKKTSNSSTQTSHEDPCKKNSLLDAHVGNID